MEHIKNIFAASKIVKHFKAPIEHFKAWYETKSDTKKPLLQMRWTINYRPGIDENQYLR